MAIEPGLYYSLVFELPNDFQICDETERILKHKGIKYSIYNKEYNPQCCARFTSYEACEEFREQFHRLMVQI